jgi:hypothetical protein
MTSLFLAIYGRVLTGGHFLVPVRSNAGITVGVGRFCESKVVAVVGAVKMSDRRETRFAGTTIVGISTELSGSGN